MRWLVIAAWAMPMVAMACEMPVRDADPSIVHIQSAEASFAYRTEPRPMPLNQPFAMDVWACANGLAGTNLHVDATMPEHGHGMNYRPSVQTMAAGKFRAEGMLFHMPGLWRISFTAQFGTKRERTSIDITVTQ